MSNNTKARQIGFNLGVRACITFLHERAQEMNDPHAKAVLNSAAFTLGVNKPVLGPTLIEQLNTAEPEFAGAGDGALK